MLFFMPKRSATLVAGKVSVPMCNQKYNFPMLSSDINHHIANLTNMLGSQVFLFIATRRRIKQNTTHVFIYNMAILREKSYDKDSVQHIGAWITCL
jgi:hypothetical protein